MDPLNEWVDSCFDKAKVIAEILGDGYTPYVEFHDLAIEYGAVHVNSGKERSHKIVFSSLSHYFAEELAHGKE